MILIPAIDIKDGQVVRLSQGQFDKTTGYDVYPLVAAKRWRDMGAQWMHLVDLDGAKTGVMRNKEHIMYIAGKIGIPVQAGGGIRDMKTAEDLIKSGVKRVILSTRAIEDRLFLKNMLALYSDKVCVSLDCSNGFVAEHGWVKVTTIKAVDLSLELEALGLQWMIYTDIARDGVMAGPNFEQVQAMLNTVKKINLIASGGVSSLEDVVKLKNLKSSEGRELWGAITGKAIYEGKLDFKKALDTIA
ncbi:MAG: 1-(5-phosphoribosyl)-5-[(5-phosphoribosylamino)methylideneamino]imidazole-4-carboxamide isomerase [Candidatus Omnitrophica bacterium]|nr:1-(5-phosphoribosyl)-5-[(5-phosphoribosylamino)methylideneamino]imidazole-4-carboxamide isomerase [Candidatus Omnitrophota bacterium]MDE2008829.1 1-(5-phosphoribosyl)-5-[(5-phosphoribosylamino)methylideneamino]imidazole-4-carboxamide isomerase [Candidatus Omnitrophota bacterium]MDE2213608.1 1-(5-phosphoribosyl)-5-[(5-phosphoribosylamino)methylideneamino]imidazole-4-carboxamide isomerase [Candidatus Omnitrophota bacterium]MDE2230491.1 1-(5-phosphoribosyl)-5-[(5-phosphoribosylamino)methylidenea